MLAAQLCLNLCNHRDCSPSVSFVHGILQTRILEWVATPSPGELPDPGVKPRSSALHADFLPSEPLKDKTHLNSMSDKVTFSFIFYLLLYPCSFKYFSLFFIIYHILLDFRAFAFIFSLSILTKAKEENNP